MGDWPQHGALSIGLRRRVGGRWLLRRLHPLSPRAGASVSTFAPLHGRRALFLSEEGEGFFVIPPLAPSAHLMPEEDQSERKMLNKSEERERIDAAPAPLLGDRLARLRLGSRQPRQTRQPETESSQHQAPPTEAPLLCGSIRTLSP